jgi:hypothetical protein
MFTIFFRRSYVRLVEKHCSSEGVDLLQSRGHVSRLISPATMMHAGHYSVPGTTNENACILWL